ncbi:phosphotransferase [Fredinandcohnia sp. 179-A 10B2 NHS]|uniref:phosphotransferase n=1 Tax=Fredinandcohnia sp. 179-A 10B2 NHS TaxID=3235176 RepID=UPI0039A0F807
MQLLYKTYKTLSNEGIEVSLKRILVWKRNKKLNRLLKLKKWEKAVNVAKSLVELHPNNVDYRLKLAKCYQQTENREMAFYTLQRGMGIRINLKEIIKMIETDLNSDHPIASKYQYLGGWQNLGLIEHSQSNNGNKLITKIASLEASKNELLFYSKISRLYSEIQYFLPKIINIRFIEQDRLCLITMEKISGVIPHIDERIIKDVIKINETISLMTYKDLDKLFEIPTARLEEITPNKMMSFLDNSFFINEENMNRKIFKSMFEHMLKFKYSSKSLMLIKDLESIIVDNQAYHLIKPEHHYSVQHGDFSLGNFLYDKSMDKLFIIDWGHMRVGPRWSDLAGFFGRYKFSFSKVNKLFLIDKNSGGKLDVIEKLFFTYLLIVVWFVVMSREEFEQNINFCLLPALNYLRSLEKK